MVDDSGHPAKHAPATTSQSTRTYVGARINVANNWANTSTNYTAKNSTQYIDNSAICNNAFNTVNSTSSYLLSYATNANDHSKTKRQTV